MPAPLRPNDLPQSQDDKGDAMTQEIWETDTLEVIVSGLFTTHHRIETPSGALGELTLPAFGWRGTFRAADGQEWVMERTRWWRGWHELRENGIVLGTARPQGFWQRKMDIGFRGLPYMLVPADIWSRRWCLMDGAGVIRLEIQPRGAFRRGARLSVRGQVDLALLVFAYYLVNARWQEQAAAAGTAAGGS